MLGLEDRRGNAICDVWVRESTPSPMDTSSHSDADSVPRRFVVSDAQLGTSSELALSH